MGIKGLWTVFTPHSEKKSLHEIRGETVAIDLSGWVCDSQNVTEYHIQPKMYLRNLFFRTIYLVLADINPIFVLEGDAPELKRDVMAARNAMQFKGATPRSEQTISANKPDVGRKRFRNVLNECQRLLTYMGVRCIKGSGEAEATCAQLNAQGLVDAVVSQDSDCFAYGARRVYRNFSVSHAAGGGAMAGSVDCYDADVMYDRNGFGRNKMVALALLCGCDYGVGACGSSITTAVSFLHTVPDSDIIPRLLSWVTDVERYEEMARKLAIPGICAHCGHAGRTHARKGCPICVTHKGCHDTGHKTKVAEIKRELSLRSRAVTCGMPFPEPKVMNEFLNNTKQMDEIDLGALKYPTPSLIQFVKLMTLKLGWEERYCVEKFLPLLTRWHLQDKVPCRTIKPIKINKKRNPKGISSYEVVWGDIDGLYEALVPDDQLQEDENRSVIWTTTERQDLIQKFYPEVVEAFEESTRKPVKEKKARVKKNKEDNPRIPKRKYTKKIKTVADEVDTDIANISGSMKNMNLSTKTKEMNLSRANASVSVNKLKRKLKAKNSKGQKTIESFIKKKIRRSSRKSMQKSERSLEKSLRYDDFDDILKLAKVDQKKTVPNNTATQNRDRSNESKHTKTGDKENIPKNNELSLLGATINDSDDTLDLSCIVHNLVTKAPVFTTAKIDNNLYRFVFDKYSTPKKSSRKSILKEFQNNCSTPKNSPIAKRTSFKFNHITNISNNAMNREVNKNISNNSMTCEVNKNISNNSMTYEVGKNVSNNYHKNTSYFFDKLTDRDAFEVSMEYNHKSGVISIDCDATVDYDYSLPDVCL